MTKKIKTYVLIVLIITLTLSIYFFIDKVNNNITINTDQFIKTKLKSKLVLYYSILDNSNRQKFVNSYNIAVDELPIFNDKKTVIGEHSKIIGDTTIIELFSKEVNNKKSLINFVQVTDGKITKKDKINGSANFSLYSFFCNQHYFYLQNRLKNESESYSINIIDENNFVDTKIFFSNKFDDFVNVKCQCDSLSIDNITRFISKTFNYINHTNIAN